MMASAKARQKMLRVLNGQEAELAPVLPGLISFEALVAGAQT